MTDLILRAATPADIPALAALGRDSFVAKFGHMYSAQDLADFLEEMHSEAAVAARLADPRRRYRLAVAGERLLGYCQIGLTCGFPDHARGSRVMELKQLYTAADATGMGIGKALTDWAMDTFAQAGADEVQLSVWSGNDGAHRFYARYGFEKVADITFRVGEQLDEEFLFAKLLRRDAKA